MLSHLLGLFFVRQLNFGGGGGGGNTVTRHEYSDQAKPYADLGFQGLVQNTTGRQYTENPYGGPVGLNNIQNQAIQATVNRATNGSPELNSSRAFLENLYRGQYKNPYADVRNVMPENEYVGVDKNPYFNTVMQGGMQDIAQKYANVTSPEIGAMQQLNGTFGSSGHGKAMEAAQGALARELGQYAAGMQNQQFDRSAGLRESAINRGAQYQNADINRAQNSWDTMFGHMMNGVPLTMQTSGADYQNLQALMGAGGVLQQDQQQNQDYLADTWNQRNDWNANQYNNFLTGLQRLTGQTGTSISNRGGRTSPWQIAGGLGMLGAGLFG